MDSKVAEKDVTKWVERFAKDAEGITVSPSLFSAVVAALVVILRPRTQLAGYRHFLSREDVSAPNLSQCILPIHPVHSRLISVLPPRDMLSTSRSGCFLANYQRRSSPNTSRPLH